MQPVEKVVIIEQYKTNVGNFIRFKGSYGHSLFCGHLVNDLSQEQVTSVNASTSALQTHKSPDV